MKLGVIISYYNEIETIHTIVSSVRSSIYDDKKIIIIDDYSTDGTRKLLEEKKFTRCIKNTLKSSRPKPLAGIFARNFAVR